MTTTARNEDIIRRSWAAEVMEMIAHWIALFSAYELTVERYEPYGENVKVLYIRSYSDIEEGRRAAAQGPPLTGA